MRSFLSLIDIFNVAPNQGSPVPVDTVLKPRLVKRSLLFGFAFVLSMGLLGCDNLVNLAQNLGEGKTKSQEAEDESGSDHTNVSQIPERERFASAQAEISCELLQTERSQHTEVSNAIMRKHGFNQMTFNVATHRYRDDAEIRVRTAELYRDCKAQLVERQSALDAAQALADEQVAEEQAAEENALAEDLADLVVSAEDLAEVDPEEGIGEQQQEEPAVDLSGRWAGNFSGSGSGTLKFSICPAGLVTGRMVSLGPGGGALRFSGKVEGNTLALEAQEVESGSDLRFSGRIQPGGRTLSGAWEGRLSRKSMRGTWRATKRRTRN